MGEQWRDVVGYEGLYEVSDAGRVRRSSDSNSAPKGYVKTQHIDAQGYALVKLWKKQKMTNKYVNRVVCESFHGPPPEGKPFALHGNGVPLDNRPSNLRWGSQSENMEDCKAHGRNFNSNKTECKRGHAYTEENTIRTKQGTRWCLTCRRARYKSDWIKLKAKKGGGT